MSAKKKAAKKVAKGKRPALRKPVAKTAAKPRASAKAKAPAKAKRAVAKAKAPAKAKRAVAKAKPAAKKSKGPVRRRDGAGHLDPKYAAKLRADMHKPEKEGRAFGRDALSSELGEEYVETVTSGEDEGNEVRDKRVTEELGGPFTVTNGGTEFADGVDASNPRRATREPFPRT
jgi:hypothetical protein